MKRFLVISYWVVSILLVAIVLTSVGYSFLEALFIGSMETSSTSMTSNFLSHGSTRMRS